MPLFAEIRVQGTGTVLFLEAKVSWIHIRKRLRTQLYPQGKTMPVIAGFKFKGKIYTQIQLKIQFYLYSR